MMRRAQRGFTLIEMMVVVAIIAILSAVLISVNGRTYGASGQTISDQLVNAFNLCRMRAVSTRRWHLCEVTGPGVVAATRTDGTQTSASTITIYQWSATGMTMPTGTCTPGTPDTNCWEQVERDSIPSGAAVWDYRTQAYGSASGLGITQVSTVDAKVYFRPDGSSTSTDPPSSNTGTTLFVTDNQGAHAWRVLVYQTTGASYARPGF